jgi:hypothetical protein
VVRAQEEPQKQARICKMHVAPDNSDDEVPVASCHSLRGTDTRDLQHVARTARAKQTAVDAVNVFIPDFSAKSPHFSAKRRIFLQIHRNTLENSKVHPIRRHARRTETYPILETFLFLFTTRRFGGVGALEKCLTTFFRELKKSCVSGGRLWNQPDFSAKLCFWRKIMDG